MKTTSFEMAFIIRGLFEKTYTHIGHINSPGTDHRFPSGRTAWNCCKTSYFFQ